MTTTAAKARAQATHDAILDESARLDEAIERGAGAVLETAFGPLQVDLWTFALFPGPEFTECPGGSVLSSSASRLLPLGALAR